MLSRWEPSRIRRAVAVTAPAAVMLGLGLWGLDRGGIWRDEAVTFQVARRSVPQIWRLVHVVDAVHGLYYLLMHAVLAVRADEVLLRLPSVCAAAVTAALIAALGTRLARPRVGLWAGLLYAVTPMAGHYAQEGRSYALVAAGATGATLLLVRAVTAGGRSWWAYGALVALTCWLHEFAVLLLLAHAVTLALARMPWPVWRGWTSAAGAAVLTLVPLVLVSRTQSAQLAWVREPDSDSAAFLAREFFGQSDGLYRTCLALAVLGASGVLGRRGGLTAAGVALPLLVVPPAALMAASLDTPLYVDRYVLYALAGAPLLTALGAERLTRLVSRRTHHASRGTRPRFVPHRRRPPLVPHRASETPSAVAVPGARGGERPSRSATRWPHRCFPRIRSREPLARDPSLPPRGRPVVPLPAPVPGALGTARPSRSTDRGTPRDTPRPHSRTALDRRPGPAPGGAPAAPSPGSASGTAAGAASGRHPGGRWSGAGRTAGLVRGTGRRLRDAALRLPLPRRPREQDRLRRRDRSRRPARFRRTPLGAAAGVLAVTVVLAVQLPLLRADRLAATRPDDLALLGALAVRELRPGDPVLFLPSQARGAALAYPAGFRGTHDVSLALPAAASGTLYGREVDERTLRHRLAGLSRVWVVAERRVLDARGYPGDPAERAKLTVVEEQFSLRAQSVRDTLALRLYVRRPPIRTPGSPAAPPRPAPW